MIPSLAKYLFRGFMIVTGFIPLSPLPFVSTMVMWESSEWLGKNIVTSTGNSLEIDKTMDRCIGRRDITEIMLKTVALQILGRKIYKNIKKSFLYS